MVTGYRLPVADVSDVALAAVCAGGCGADAVKNDVMTVMVDVATWASSVPARNWLGYGTGQLHQTTSFAGHATIRCTSKSLDPFSVGFADLLVLLR